jgi:hypothetical protein
MVDADVAVIGCGPAGLLSAHACVQAGLRVDIFSDKAEQSPMAQGVFLHGAIPGITHRLPDALLLFKKVGDGRTYAKKVYGYVRPTSWDRYRVGQQAGWYLAPAYDALWALYAHRITKRKVTAHGARRMVKDYRLVINTAPAWALCDGDHFFEQADIYLVAGAPPEVEQNSVLYNGREQDAWYRAQDLWGHRVTEYAHPPGAVDGEVRKGFKVVQTDCDCHPEIMRNGRYGMWKPGILLHQAYERAREAAEAVT